MSCTAYWSSLPLLPPQCFTAPSTSSASTWHQRVWQLATVERFKPLLINSRKQIHPSLSPSVCRYVCLVRLAVRHLTESIDRLRLVYKTCVSFTFSFTLWGVVVLNCAVSIFGKHETNLVSIMRAYFEDYFQGGHFQVMFFLS